MPCARITTRVFHPSRNQVATVQNVLVRTAPLPVSGGTHTNHHNNNPNSDDDDDDDDSFSSGMSSSSASSDDSMNIEDDSLPSQSHVQAQALQSDLAVAHTHAQTHTHAHNQTNINANAQAQVQTDLVQNAYWIQRTIREAIYGRVLFAVVLKRRHSTIDGAEWEVTSEHCAVKEMAWAHIRKERDRLAEDPIKEVSAMQYIQKWYEHTNLRTTTDTHIQSTATDALLDDVVASTAGAAVAESFRAMRESNIMMPLDLLTDERNLYSIMPYCDGGELFERLDLNERFSEDEARYWMDQILNGIENLQHAGICHRDMSLENLLVHKDGALIIDMGMCLMVPYDDSATGLASSFHQMNVNGSTVAHTVSNIAPLPPHSHPSHPQLSGRRRSRHLILPQGTCGKWIYMSPEIYQNTEPFDGFAVDMWAAGVILFLMLTGFPPWERACPTDERFHYMTAGYLVQMLTEWEIGLTSDAMDLLQRMLFLDPKDRLSLDQVRAHPWMINGQRARPLGL